MNTGLQSSPTSKQGLAFEGCVAFHEPTATPLVDLWFAGWPVKLKLEKDNPSGSHKYRPAEKLAQNLYHRGIIGNGNETLFVMPSSGNAARAFAHCTVGMNVKLLVVTDVLSPREQPLSLTRYQHVEIEVINSPDETGSHVRARRAFIDAFLRKQPEAILIDQYASSFYPLGYFSLIKEIEAQCTPSAVFVPVGTAATLLSLAKFRETHRRGWKLFGVDADGSALFSKPIGKRLNSGYGNGAPTEWSRLARPSVDAVIRVPDDAAISACHWMSATQGLHLGASSGATLAAFRWATRHVNIPAGGLPVLVMPDSGDLYASTVYSDAWLGGHGFSHLAPKLAT
jgi:cysteine synthase A